MALCSTPLSASAFAASASSPDLKIDEYGGFVESAAAPPAGRRPPSPPDSGNDVVRRIYRRFHEGSINDGKLHTDPRRRYGVGRDVVAAAPRSARTAPNARNARRRSLCPADAESHSDGKDDAENHRDTSLSSFVDKIIGAQTSTGCSLEPPKPAKRARIAATTPPPPPPPPLPPKRPLAAQTVAAAEAPVPATAAADTVEQILAEVRCCHRSAASLLRRNRAMAAPPPPPTLPPSAPADALVQSVLDEVYLVRGRRPRA